MRRHKYEVKWHEKFINIQNLFVTIKRLSVFITVQHLFITNQHLFIITPDIFIALYCVYTLHCSNGHTPLSPWLYGQQAKTNPNNCHFPFGSTQNGVLVFCDHVTEWPWPWASFWKCLVEIGTNWLSAGGTGQSPPDKPNYISNMVISGRLGFRILQC